MGTRERLDELFQMDRRELVERFMRLEDHCNDLNRALRQRLVECFAGRLSIEQINELVEYVITRTVPERPSAFEGLEAPPLLADDRPTMTVATGGNETTGGAMKPATKPAE